MLTAIDEDWYWLREIRGAMDSVSAFDILSLCVITLAAVVPVVLTIVLWRKDRRDDRIAATFNRRKSAVLAAKVALSKIVEAKTPEDLALVKQGYTEDFMSIGVEIVPSDIEVLRWIAASRISLFRAASQRMKGDFTVDVAASAGPVNIALLDWLHGEKQVAWFEERRKTMDAEADATHASNIEAAIADIVSGAAKPFMTGVVREDGPIKPVENGSGPS